MVSILSNSYGISVVGGRPHRVAVLVFDNDAGLSSGSTTRPMLPLPDFVVQVQADAVIGGRVEGRRGFCPRCR